jgi:hypothetical protein
MVLVKGGYGGYPSTTVLMNFFYSFNWACITKLMVLEKGFYGDYPSNKILMTFF